MNEVIQKAIARNEASKKTSVSWKANEPQHQSYFLFNEAEKIWESFAAETGGTPTLINGDDQGINRLALYAWNIDFMLPFAESRMRTGLKTLQDLTSRLPSSTAVVIYLQECVESDLSTIADQAWIRERFALTDLTHENWASSYYGTTTLVDRRLPISSLFRVHYEKTRMERDALFVDVLLGGQDKKKVRLCNTHLESLDMMPPYRPPQVQLVARYLKEAGLHAGIAAGDFNAIQDFDRALHNENGLKDAYLELGGKEDSEEGYTWGQQAATFLRQKFGCSRMDKVYLFGGLALKNFERFGTDVLLDDPKERDNIVALGFEKPWITDHLGICAEFEISEKSDVRL
jgi:tyrosyl-DNA phosphodiesterase 2